MPGDKKEPTKTKKRDVKAADKAKAKKPKESKSTSKGKSAAPAKGEKPGK